MSNFEEGGAPRTGRLNRADILAAALELLDEVGLPDLSMRRLAAKLDMQPSGLYWHFENKQTLLARISDHIVNHIKPEEDSSANWQDRSLTSAFALRDSLLAFRDGSEIVSSSLALGLGAQDALEQLLVPLSDSGMSPQVVKVAAESILFLVLGQVWHTQQRMAADSLGVTSPSARAEVRDFEGANSLDPLASGVELILIGLAQGAKSGSHS